MFKSKGKFIKSTKESNTCYIVWSQSDKPVVFYNSLGTVPQTDFAHYFYTCPELSRRDAVGDRVKKITRKGQQLEVTVYMDGGLFELSYVKVTGSRIDPNNHYNIFHVLDGTSRISTVRVGNDANDPTPPIKYYLEDHTSATLSAGLGNSTVVLTTTGALVNLEEFYPFGETSFGSFAKKRYSYNGKEKDEESGLYEYGQRYYAPWLCRFVSLDPIAEDFPYYTSYNYAGNKAESKVDLDGLQETDAKKGLPANDATTSTTYTGLFQNNKSGTIIHGTFTDSEAKAKNLTVLVGVDPVMARSERSTGMALDGSSVAPDLTFGDGWGQREFMVQNIDDYENLSNLTDAQLFDNLFDLMENVSKDDMETNNRSMINHFRESSGEPYSNHILSNEVRKHPSYQRFIGQIQSQIEDRLKSANGNVRSLQELTLIGQPRFNENTLYFFGDRFNGLTFAINDTRAYEVKLLELSDNGTEYTGKFSVSIYDHFGLDPTDIENFGSFEGFGSWYILQHERCYRPFITVIKSSYAFMLKYK